MKQALIVWGGWDGHQPQSTAELYKTILETNEFQVQVSDTLDSLRDYGRLAQLDLLVPNWTMGEISDEQVEPVLLAVANGTGLAGTHGGLCDSFRRNTPWQFMTGGNWVSHPGGDGTDYRVNIRRASSSSIIAGIEDFSVISEQYYLHVDPAVEVLATTRFPVKPGPHAANGGVDMPVIWTKRWGRGRVFYTSLGHHTEILEAEPIRTLLTRGFLWAADKDQGEFTPYTMETLKTAF